MMKNFRKQRRLVRRKWFWFKQKYVDGYSFIHINKCGGTSIERFLGLPKVHDTALRRIKRIGQERWDRNYTFALVRNPYAKVVSHYRYRLKTGQTGLGDGRIDLNEWVHLTYGDRDPRYVNKPLMFEPCFHWVSIGGRIVVDDIIRLEDIDAHWSDVCAKIGVAYEPLRTRNATAGTSTEDAIALLDARSRTIINDHFAADFAQFDYAQVD